MCMRILVMWFACLFVLHSSTWLEWMYTSTSSITACDEHGTSWVRSIFIVGVVELKEGAVLAHTFLWHHTLVHVLIMDVFSLGTSVILVEQACMWVLNIAFDFKCGTTSSTGMAMVAMAKETALPPTKGENCTSEPHHVVNYCIKSCLSFSRGATHATSFIVKLTQTSKQTNRRLHLLPPMPTIPYSTYCTGTYIARVIGYQMCQWEPRGFFVKDFCLPPKVSSVGMYAHRSWFPQP